MESANEWLELYNNSGKPISLAGVSIWIKGKSKCKLTGSLAPGAYLLVHKGAAGSPTGSGLKQTCSSLAHNDEGSRITIVSGGAPVFDLSYGNYTVDGGVLFHLAKPAKWTALQLDGELFSSPQTRIQPAAYYDLKRWCPASKPWGPNGDTGTPGHKNTNCN